MTGVLFAIDGALWPPLVFFTAVITTLLGFFGNLYDLKSLLYGVYGSVSLGLTGFCIYIWAMMHNFLPSGVYSVALFGKTTILYILSSNSAAYSSFWNPKLLLNFIGLSSLIFIQVALTILSLFFMFLILFESPPVNADGLDESSAIVRRDERLANKLHFPDADIFGSVHVMERPAMLSTAPPLEPPISSPTPLTAQSMARPPAWRISISDHPSRDEIGTYIPAADFQTTPFFSTTSNNPRDPASFIIQMERLHKAQQENTLNAEAPFESVPLSASSTTQQRHNFASPMMRRKGVMTPEKLVKELEQLKENSSVEKSVHPSQSFGEPAQSQPSLPVHLQADDTELHQNNVRHLDYSPPMHTWPGYTTSQALTQEYTV